MEGQFRTYRSSREKSVLKNFAEFTGKHLYQGFFSLLKKRLRRRCLPVNFAKFLRTLFL